MAQGKNPPRQGCVTLLLFSVQYKNEPGIPARFDYIMYFISYIILSVNENTRYKMYFIFLFIQPVYSDLHFRWFSPV
jgi:hypothetical protein